MESHKRILGILFTISGVLRIFGALIVLALSSFILPLILENTSSDELWIVELIQNLFQVIIWIFILFFSLPRLIAGIGLLNKKPWALMMALIWGILGVFSFPLGTALCGYTIWVYVEDNKEKRATA